MSSTPASQSTPIPDFARPTPRSPGSAPESDPSRPFSLPGAGGIPINPLEIGRSDLEPLGGGIRNPFAPPSLFGGVGGGLGGDGMYVGPSHPMFRDRMDPLIAGGVGGGRAGPWGGDGYLPPMGAPPGARFDPVGPFGPGRGPGPGFPGTAGPRRAFGPGGGGGASGPDNDEFMPPGFVRRISRFSSATNCYRLLTYIITTERYV